MQFNVIPVELSIHLSTPLHKIVHDQAKSWSPLVDFLVSGLRRDHFKRIHWTFFVQHLFELSSSEAPRYFTSFLQRMHPKFQIPKLVVVKPACLSAQCNPVPKELGRRPSYRLQSISYPIRKPFCYFLKLKRKKVPKIRITMVETFTKTRVGIEG